MQVRTCTILAGAVLAFLLALGGLAYGESAKGQLNINTATIEELQLLPGIGPATAQNILNYREINGPFTSVEDIIKVKGVGDRKLEQLRRYLKTDGKTDFEPREAPSPEESL
ncbi:MAG: helix-hairpin-helix domain-containing protein [Desulfomonilia bacterium]|jgi:competence protein ComEA|nr:helix-hairpin-helix domain-containing protein [Deltaproteobacteria bacterium]MDX9761933.1 helix-hairpin-helix domain-containing protein [Desulfomonilia bacterium]HPW69387.1 helix-hairpin-helix domain-containing protein [Deltaproteobacteria bacterium]